MTETTRRTYDVGGMSCEHCRASVAERASQVAGVEAVSVDLRRGRLHVSGTGFSDREIEVAVREAGYEAAPI